MKTVYLIVYHAVVSKKDPETKKIIKQTIETVEITDILKNKKLVQSSYIFNLTAGSVDKNRHNIDPAKLFGYYLDKYAKEVQAFNAKFPGRLF